MQIEGMLAFYFLHWYGSKVCLLALAYNIVQSKFIEVGYKNTIKQFTRGSVSQGNGMSLSGERFELKQHDPNNSLTTKEGGMATAACCQLPSLAISLQSCISSSRP